MGRQRETDAAIGGLWAIVEIVQKGLATVNALICGGAVYLNVHKAFSGKCVSICSEVHALILGNAIAFPKVKRVVAGQGVRRGSALISNREDCTERLSHGERINLRLRRVPECTQVVAGQGVRRGSAFMGNRSGADP